jgi:RNA polymerase sigma factor (sigma-70 family)
MAPGPLALVLRQLRHFLGPQPDADLSDGQLLQRFVSRGDQAAFAALMHRHAPLVYGVCRRVLRQTQDAEDAFQAAFLVLARRAASIRRHQALAAWLHRVAYHLAVRARAAAVRRRLLEQETDAMPTTDPSVEAMRRELRPLLDEELGRLPAKYRYPLLLCHLEGKTHEQAARELGWPVGTMSRRLARGRELLRGRLLRRGVTLPAALLVPALAAELADAAAPAALLDTTLRAAAGFAAGPVAGTASANAVVLAEGALRLLASAKVKAAAALLLLVGLLAAGAGLLTRQVLAAKPFAAEPAAGPKDPAPGEEAKQPPRTDAHGDPLPDGAVARLGSARLRHGNAVMRVAYAPNGRLVASGGNRTVKLWDTTTGRLVRELIGHTPDHNVSSLSFSPDGRLLASGGEDWTVRLWDVATGKQLHLLRPYRFGHLGTVSCEHVAFLPDGTGLVSGAFDGVVQVWDVGTGTERFRMQPPLPQQRKPHEDPELIMALAVAPDGKTVAVANSARTIRLWDLARRNVGGEIDVASTWVRDLAFSPDGKTLAWCGTSPSPAQPSEGIRLWDLKAGKLRLHLPGHRAGRCYGLSFSGDGRRLASSGYDNAVKVWDTDTGKELRSFAGHTDTPWSVAFAPDGLTVASGSADGSVRLWDVAEGKERLPNPAGDLGRVLALRVAPDGKTVLTADKNKIVRRWDLADGRPRASFSLAGRQIEGVAFSPDATAIAVGRGAAVELWDTSSGRPRWVQADVRPAPQVAPFRHPYTGFVAFSLDGLRLATVTDDSDDSGGELAAVRVWETATGKLVTLLHRPCRISAPPAFSRDGRTLALAEYRSKLNEPIQHIGLRLFDVETGRLVREGPSRNFLANALALAPDGKTLAAALGGQVQFLDAATGEVRFTLWGLRCGVGLNRLAFSPDGNRLAAAGDYPGGLVQVWEIATGKQTHELLLDATALEFTPDGRRLVVGQAEGTALVWDLAAPATALPPPRALTPQEIATRWQELGYGSDSSRGNAGNYARTEALVQGGDRTVAFLETVLRWPDLARQDEELIRRLVAPLADPRPAVRARAVQEIAKWGDRAWVWVEDLGDAPANAETLKGLEEDLRQNLEYRRSSHGAIDVLYQIATPRAQRLLARLAESPGDTLEIQNRKTMAGFRLEELQHIRLRRARSEE